MSGPAECDVTHDMMQVKQMMMDRKVRMRILCRRDVGT